MGLASPLRSFIALLGISAFLTSLSRAEDTQTAAAESVAAIEAQLEDRVRRDPSDASAWRMLGRLRMQNSDLSGALNALRTSIDVDPLSAAAFADFAAVSREMGDEAEAAGALERVIELAPDSEYAAAARVSLAQMTASGVVPVRYEVRTFDGSNDAPLIRDPRDEEETDSFFQTLKKDLDLRIDLGTQYNDNVSMLPSSREDVFGSPASAQGTASISARYIAWTNDTFRFGPTLDVDYTLNEGNFDNLNLQSYRGGAFADAVFEFDDIKVKPRVAYSYTHDLFGGNTFGRRHTLATSVGFVWSPSQITTAYWSIDNNGIISNRPFPEITSQDGTSNTIGLLHDWVRRESKLRTVRLGADFTHADTEGSNFRFNGSSLYAQTVYVIVPKLHLTTKGGWAFRDYYDFTDTPSRNTHIFRAGAELRQYFENGFSLAAVSQFNTFVTRNRNFRSERFLIGMVGTWEY